jgi:NDP-sugar pyrophosphorylase family protein
VRAAGILVVQDSSYSCALSSFSSAGLPFGNRNLALLDLLGESVLNRIISRLQRYGIQRVSVVANTDLAHAPHLSWDASAADLDYNPSGELWASVERLIFDYAKQDIKALVLVQVSAYAEVDYFDVLRFHRANGKLVTTVGDSEGPLNITVLDLTKPMECAELLRNSWNGGFWDRNRSNAGRYVFNGYINRLENAYDFRRLAKDALTRRCELRPLGREVRPGVWLGQGARVDSRARVLAPSYIGAYSKIRAAALVTRVSTVEHHCEVDCGTVIDDASVLPFSYLGPGLEVAHAMVDGGRLMHLAHNLELQIRDHRLLGRLRSPNPILRVRDKVLARLRSGASQDSFAPTEATETASLNTAGEIAP